MDKINRLKELRLERGISQEKCAEETGISCRYGLYIYSKWSNTEK